MKTMKIILVISLISAIISTVDFDLEQVRKDLLDRHNYYRENQHLSFAVGGTGIRVVVGPPNDVLEGLAYAPKQSPPPKPELPPFTKTNSPVPKPSLPKSPGFIYAPDQAQLQAKLIAQPLDHPELPPVPQPIVPRPPLRFQDSSPPIHKHKRRNGRLTRSSALEKLAQSHSEKLASLGYLVHSSNTLNGNKIGENLYIWKKDSGYLGSKPVDEWYSEIKDYDFEQPEFSPKTSHFTQVVWENTKQVGCGVSCDEKDYCYITCNYFPAGNYFGQFKTNVLPLNDSIPEDTTTPKEKTKPVNDTSKQEKSDIPVQETSNESELEIFRKIILLKHNYYRDLHQVGNLERDPFLEKIAQKTAEHMKETGNFAFVTDKCDGKPIGQNIFWFGESFTGDDVIDMWYKSENKYDYKNPKYSSDTEDFTQIVWKNTQKIGCGYACNDKECYGLCTYYPAGNYLNQFSSNVFTKK